MVDIVPTIGRIVLYTLNHMDAENIAIQRCENATGVYHINFNIARAGDVYPAIVVRPWGTTPTSTVNLSVILDGGDTYWATSRIVGEGPGHYQWMEYQKTQAAKHAAPA